MSGSGSASLLVPPPTPDVSKIITQSGNIRTFSRVKRLSDLFADPDHDPLAVITIIIQDDMDVVHPFDQEFVEVDAGNWYIIGDVPDIVLYGGIEIGENASVSFQNIRFESGVFPTIRAIGQFSMHDTNINGDVVVPPGLLIITGNNTIDNLSIEGNAVVYGTLNVDKLEILNNATIRSFGTISAVNVTILGTDINIYITKLTINLNLANKADVPPILIRAAVTGTVTFLDISIIEIPNDIVAINRSVIEFQNGNGIITQNNLIILNIGSVSSNHVIFNGPGVGTGLITHSPTNVRPGIEFNI